MMRPIPSLLLLIATILVLSGCTDQPTGPDDPGSPDAEPAVSAKIHDSSAETCDAAPPERAHLNRIEDVATPEPFSCFGLHAPGSAQGNQAKLDIELADESDGIDPVAERVLISLNGDLLALSTGSFEPQGKDQWIYAVRGRNNAKPSGPIRRIELRGPDPKGVIELKIHVQRPSQLSGRLLVRVGNDWGGLDLDTGERVDGAPELDTGAAVSASVGPEGGTVSAGGWTLTVLAGALDAATELTLTPFADGSGVHLEPHGLRFDRPATLEGGHGTPVLRSSPLSALPLYEGPDGGAVLWHFSLVQTTGLAAVPDLTDFPVWAEAALDDLGEMTVSEAQQLIALAAQQQATGCETDCIDLDALADAMSEVIAALADSACQEDVDDPTDAAVTRWLALAADVEALGGDGRPAIDCAIDIFGALVAEAREAAVEAPSDPNIQRLVDLWGEAQALGAHEDTVVEALEAALRSLLENGSALCEIGETEAGTGELERGLEWIDALGPPFAGSELEADFETAVENCECTANYEILVAPRSLDNAYDLNEDGVVTGRTDAGEAALWENTTVTIIHDPAIEGRSPAAHLNDRGEVVGRLFTSSSGVRRLFYWSADDGMIPIELREEDHIEHERLDTRDINNNGEAVASWFVFPNSVEQEVGFRSIGYVWRKDGTSRQLRPLEDFDDVLEVVGALGINDQGQIVGGATADAEGNPHAVLWESPIAAPTDLGTFEGQERSVARAITEEGEVVGTSGNHGFLWTEGAGMTNLTPPGFFRTRALDINDDGDVIGLACETQDSSSCFPILWQDENGDGAVEAGEMTDLNTLIDATSGWRLHYLRARAINNAGVILAKGVHDEIGGRWLLLEPSNDGAAACSPAG